MREPREVTADFESVPLPEALARLLGGQDSALVYGEGGRLKAVRLVGGDQLGAPASPTTTVPPAAPGRRSRPLSRSSSIAILPCRLPASLADALGAQSATLRQLLDLSLHHGDPAVRAEAVRTGLATVEAKPELRSAVIGELNNADSALLGALLRASEQAEDVATQIWRDSRAAEIRVKALSVLQRLRAGG